MEKILKAFKGKKKISMDIDEEVLEAIDELADLTKNSRTVIIEAILTNGLFSYLKFIENTWKRYHNEEKNDKVKKEIERLLQGLEEIKKKNKWLTPDYYKDYISMRNDLDDNTKNKMINVLKDMNLVKEDKEKYKK